MASVKNAFHLIIAAYFFAASSAWGSESVKDDATLCEQAVTEGARVSGVPAEVLHAISLSETGREQDGRMRPWPWAVNVGGAGQWFPDREAAIRFARSVIASGKTNVDMGCFQINYHWHGQKFGDLDEMFDPVGGAVYAGMFLRDLFAETGSWSEAAGDYHSRSEENATIYRARFDRILEDVQMGAPIVVAGADVSIARGGRSRLRMATRPLIISVGEPETEGFSAASGRVSAPRAGGARVIRIDPGDIQPIWTAPDADAPSAVLPREPILHTRGGPR